MNLVIVSQFFKTIYTGIFQYFLAVVSIKNSLVELVLIYFWTIKRNS